MESSSFVPTCRAAVAGAAIASFLVAANVAAQSLPANGCVSLHASELDRRVDNEAQLGLDSFKQFVGRTRMVYQLDLRTEVAKIDQRRDSARACMARLHSADSNAVAANDASKTADDNATHGDAATRAVANRQP